MFHFLRPLHRVTDWFWAICEAQNDVPYYRWVYVLCHLIKIQVLLTASPTESCEKARQRMMYLIINQVALNCIQSLWYISWSENGVRYYLIMLDYLNIELFRTCTEGAVCSGKHHATVRKFRGHHSHFKVVAPIIFMSGYEYWTLQ